MSKPLFYHTDTGSTKSSAVYQSVPTLSSPALQAPHTTSQPIDENLLPSRKKPLTLQVAGITVLLTLCTVVPILPWAWYVFIHKHTTIDWPNLLVISTAGPTQFLLLPTVSMTVSKILIAPLLALYAYSVSADWIRSSATGARGRQPSPMHLASLLSLFQGASFFSLATVTLAGTKRRRLAWPPILKRVVALLIWLLFLIYSLTAINVWLNVDARPTTNAPLPIDETSTSSGTSPEATWLSRRVDEASCQKHDLDYNNKYCGALNYNGTDKDASSGPEMLLGRFGHMVLLNNSATSRAAWLDDNTAVLVPSTTPTFDYVAQALGVRAVCRSVTDQCAECTGMQPDTAIKCKLASKTELALACPPSLRINVTYNQPESLHEPYRPDPIGPLSTAATEGDQTYVDFGDNPIAYRDIVKSRSYEKESLTGQDHFVGNTGFLKYEEIGYAFNIMACDITVYDVEYQFTPPENFTTRRSAPTSASTASYVALRLELEWRRLRWSLELVDGLGQSGNATYSALYSRQLSKTAVAFISDIALPSAAVELGSIRISGTHVTLIGMMLLAIVLGLLIITTITIGVQAAIVITHTDSKFLAAARGRLISVYPLIGDSFGGLKADCDCHKTAVSAALGEDAFLRETEADRLQLVQEPVEGGAADGVTVRLRPRRIGKEDEERYQ